LTIHLPEHLERYVHDQVRAGRYLTEQDVICDALERHRQSEPTPASATGQPELSPEEIADQELQRRLLAAGVISEIKPPITDVTPYRNRRAVAIQGEPISETAIRERR
jgi:Arc/MetJ-type ribon-helix-helix transcriptional regulator